MAKIKLTESKLEKILERIVVEYSGFKYDKKGTRTIIISGGEQYGKLIVPIEFPDEIYIDYDYTYIKGEQQTYDYPGSSAEFDMSNPVVSYVDEDYQEMIPEIQEWVNQNWGSLESAFSDEECEEVVESLYESKSSNKNLLKEEKLILESILISENVVDKFKDLLRKGMVTGAIVASLLSAQNISAQDKADINKIAKENNIEVKRQDALYANKTITSRGIGKASDLATAKKKALSNAKYQASVSVSNDTPNLEFDIANVNITKENITKQPDGSYICEVYCTVLIQVGDNNLAKTN